MREVASPVHPLLPALRVLKENKALRGPLRIMIVALRQRLAGDADLTRLPRLRHLTPRFVQQPDRPPREGLSDRKAIEILRRVRRDPVEGAVTGDLGRAVKIDEFRPRHRPSPYFQLLERHRFPAEQNDAHGLRHIIVQALQRGNRRECGHSPGENRDFPLIQVVDQLRGQREQLPVDQHQLRTGRHRGIDVLH